MTQWKPEGRHNVTPRLVARDPEALVRFLKDAFGADGEFTSDMPSDMLIGDSIVMVSGAGPREATSSFLYLYVEDADATYERALKAGAKSIESPSDMPYGDRRAMIEDVGGNVWQIATHRGLA
ncbi:MAG: VOC family protein [Candidatus Eremiobacteraeota bacterium]|nr:VOC family protein [Candidatus Eremiobacteraeota bacterium]